MRSITLQTLSAPVKPSRTGYSRLPARTLFLVRLMTISAIPYLSGCASNAAQVVTNSAAGSSTAGLKSIANTLKSDPRFSDFVNVVDLAGLGWDLDDATNVTVFAPTNLAFATSDPSWRTRTNLSGPDNSDTDMEARQTLMKASGVIGIHPPQDFLGKLQDVRSIGGQVFHVDGMTPGTITITTGIKGSSGMGFGHTVAGQTAHVTLLPIRAKGGLIYPVDAVIVP